MFTENVTHIPAEWANRITEVADLLVGNSNVISAEVILLRLGILPSNTAEITKGFITGTLVGSPASPCTGVFSSIAITTPAGSVSSVATIADIQAAQWKPPENSVALQTANSVDITGGTIKGVVVGTSDTNTSGVFYSLKRTTTAKEGNDVITLDDLRNVSSRIPTVGTLSRQDYDAVNLRGGAINNTIIGNTNPTSGSFSKVITSEIGTAYGSVTFASFSDTDIGVAINSTGNGVLRLPADKTFEVCIGSGDSSQNAVFSSAGVVFNGLLQCESASSRKFKVAGSNEVPTDLAELTSLKTVNTLITRQIVVPIGNLTTTVTDLSRTLSDTNRALRDLQLKVNNLPSSQATVSGAGGTISTVNPDLLISSSNSLVLSSGANKHVCIQTCNEPRLKVFNTGEVVIGGGNANQRDYALQVYGAAKVTGKLQLSAKQLNGSTSLALGYNAPQVVRQDAPMYIELEVVVNGATRAVIIPAWELL